MRFVRLAFAGLMALALVCGSAVLIGRVQPAMPLLPELHQCQDRMCLFDITPDKTRWGEALAALSTSLVFRNVSANIMSIVNPTPPPYRLDLVRSTLDGSLYSDSGV